MVSALQRNIPVVIGVDYGNPSPNLDHTTNHFVVVVGMGTDANGRIYFRFYDNYTANPVYGTSQLNTVTYNSATGELTGGFIGVQNRVPPISYKVAQIRKSFK